MIPESYQLIKEETVAEVNGQTLLLEHRKTGAKLILVDCADTNRVFSIGFRTPPSDDTGVPHIMEHSVLCGSENYPVKDPFVELCKGSLNTYLNAMTYPEKTVYPVASTNETDFRNLMSVYLDAVFHPNIYRNELILKQEGWHYELSDREAPVTLNGVVYNEMRGAFSDPDSVLERYMKRQLFPDTAYAYESGGDPEHIPDLTYDDFIAFHKRYYHPSNAYIYLYGALDFEALLRFIDEAYLSDYDRIEPDSAIALQSAFDAPVTEEIRYGISESEDEDDNLFASAWVVNDYDDPVKTLAMEVLSYALLNAPGAPIKKALLDAGIGADIYGGSDTGYRQPVFSVISKGAARADFDRFTEIVDRTLTEVVENGIPEKTLRAAIHNIEFSLREGDYGRFPKGLAIGLQIYETWMNDGIDPLLYIKYNDVFDRLKACVGTDFYTDLVREKLIGNPHRALTIVSPEKGLTQKKDAALAAKLQAFKASLTEEGIDRLIRDTEALKAYQAEPSPEAELRKIPMLSIDDIEKHGSPFSNEERSFGDTPVVFHDIDTAGIVYFDVRFDMGAVPEADLQAAVLLKNLLGNLSTEHFDYQELNDEISLYTGGLGFDISTYQAVNDIGTVHESFYLRARALYEDIPDTLRLMAETALCTDFSDDKRILEVISEMRTEMRDNMTASGHSTALKRALSYGSVYAAEDDLLIGVGFYKYIEDIEAHYGERKAELKETFGRLVRLLFRKENMTLSLTAEEAGFEKAGAAWASFADRLSGESFEKAPRHIVPVKRNEGFMTSSQVQYVAMGGNFRAKGFSYTGAMRVLHTILGYDYLWTNLRVKGGAYGCFSLFTREGEMAFVSYRDPNLKETLAVYEGIPDYLRNISLDERNRTKYIIGTISGIDTPLTPSLQGRRSFGAYLQGLSYDMIEKERTEILNCSEADLRALAGTVEAVLADRALCVVGGEEKIRDNEAVFMELKELTGKDDE